MFVFFTVPMMEDLHDLLEQQSILFWLEGHLNWTSHVRPSTDQSFQGAHAAWIKEYFYTLTH